MRDFSAKYVVRYGWTRAGVVLFAATALFVAVGFVPPLASPGTDHIELVVSPFALWIMVVGSSRRKVFQADKHGITLCRFLPFRKAQFVPWDDVVAVDWSSERRFWGAHTTLSVLRRRTPRPGIAQLLAPEGEGTGASAAPEAGALDLPPFPSTITIGRDTTFSRVDPVEMATALDILAPDVKHFGDLGDLAMRRADIAAAARELSSARAARSRTPRPGRPRSTKN